MPKLDPSAYSGSIAHQGEAYPFRAANPNDAKRLAEMYESVAITRSNYRAKLNPGPDDFSKTGGMFLVHDEDSIVEEMERDRSLFGIIESPGGSIAAMLWVSEEDPAFRSFKLDGRETLVFAREIIVMPGGFPRLCSLMYYTMFASLEKMGFTHSIGEVYRVLGYKDEDGMHMSSLVNERSRRTLVKAGATLLGQNLVREVLVRSIPIKAVIVPQIVYFDFAGVIPILERTVNAAGIVVNFEGVAENFEGNTEKFGGAF